MQKSLMVNWYMPRFMILRQKKWDHLRTFFATSEYRYPEVVNILMNLSAKIFWGVAQGPITY